MEEKTNLQQPTLQPPQQPGVPTEINHPDYNDVRTLLSWSAPGRPFRKKGREFYFSVGLLVMLLEIILFLFSQYEAMLAVGSLAFVAVILHTIPPKDFHYKITSEGVRVEDHFYIWSELYDFYFKTIDGMSVLIIRTEALIPGELKISLGNVVSDHVRKVLVRFLPYREVVKPSFMEKSADWLSRNFPLEKR